MSRIEVHHEHDLDRAQARLRIGAIEDKLGQYGIRLTWKGDEATIKGVGVSGSVVLSEGRVDLVLKLGMIARAAGVDADRLRGAILKRMAQAFGDEVPVALLD
jgi:putative polyhydroxyalkanoate system protein